jgi:hypothetical protein
MKVNHSPKTESEIKQGKEWVPKSGMTLSRTFDECRIKFHIKKEDFSGLSQIVLLIVYVFTLIR